MQLFSFQKISEYLKKNYFCVVHKWRYRLGVRTQDSHS